MNYELPPAEVDRVIHLDRKYELALLAETLVDSAPIVIGEARYALQRTHESAGAQERLRHDRCGLRPIGSKANSHFRSHTTGAARGSARCSWPTSNAGLRASARGIFSVTYCGLAMPG
jgi:hypothetical protein